MHSYICKLQLQRLIDIRREGSHLYKSNLNNLPLTPFFFTVYATLFTQVIMVPIISLYLKEIEVISRPSEVAVVD